MPSPTLPKKLMVMGRMLIWVMERQFLIRQEEAPLPLFFHFFLQHQLQSSPSPGSSHPKNCLVKIEEKIDKNIDINGPETRWYFSCGFSASLLWWLLYHSVTSVSDGLREVMFRLRAVICTGERVLKRANVNEPPKICNIFSLQNKDLGVRIKGRFKVSKNSAVFESPGFPLVSLLPRLVVIVNWNWKLLKSFS